MSSGLSRSMMDEALKRGVVKSKIMRVLYTVKILRDGWEMDGWGWIVETEKGVIQGLTTSHGAICRWRKREMNAYIKQLTEATKDAQAAVDLLGKFP
jgi:hypothetical protein